MVRAAPEDAGRIMIVRHETGARPVDVLPAEFSARTRVHEYGGGAWWVHDGTLFFTNWADQRIYRVDPGPSPTPISRRWPHPRAREAHGDRYADGVVTAVGAG